MTRETPEEHEFWYSDVPFARPFDLFYTRRENQQGFLSKTPLFHTLSEDFVLGAETIVITPDTWSNGEE